MDDRMRAPLTVFSILPLLLSPIGCQETNPSRENDTHAAPGITVSLPAPGERDLPPDGGNAVIVAAESSGEDEISALIQTLQDLTNHEFSDSNDGNRTQMDRHRHLRMVEIATDIMRMTAQLTDRQQEFQFALRQRLASRLQLALTGSREDVDQLYRDVETLNSHDESSIATAEGIYTLARFAHAMAKRSGDDDVRWFENFSRWAREFSRRFPNQTERASALLLGAGRSCEVQMMKESEESAKRLRQQAKLCFAELAEKYPDRIESSQAAAALRRMALPGSPLTQFSGPVQGGGNFSSTDVQQGQTLIYFWQSGNPEFEDALLPVLRGLPDSVQLVGVCLDTSSETARSTTDRLRLRGRQIVFSGADAGWNSPLARFWAIPASPCCWILRDGTVIAVDVSAEELQKKIQ